MFRSAQAVWAKNNTPLSLLDLFCDQNAKVSVWHFQANSNLVWLEMFYSAAKVGLGPPKTPSSCSSNKHRCSEGQWLSSTRGTHASTLYWPPPPPLPTSRRHGAACSHSQHVKYRGFVTAVAFRSAAPFSAGMKRNGRSIDYNVN